MAQQRDLKPGLNYTTIAKPKPAQAAQEAEMPREQAPVSENDETTKDAATRVWNKYKELATGQAGEAQETTAKTGVTPPEKPTIEKPVMQTTHTGEPEKPAANNAFGAILQEWKNSKKSQREMRSKSFKVPNVNHTTPEKPETPDTPQDSENKS